MKPVEELGISPAPWDCALTETSAWVEEAHGLSIADMSTCELPDLDQAHANARLIAAAPDLYEALRLCMKELCSACKQNTALPCATMCETMCVAREAIEKAGGAE